MTNYKSRRIIGWVVIDKNGNIINRSPNKEELKTLKKEPRSPQDTRKDKKYTDEDLLNELRRYEKENGKPPGRTDFDNNPGYPGHSTYRIRFGSWGNALKLVGLDVESMIKKGAPITNHQKARLAETMIINHFKTCPIDLAGENCLSPCDGICPNGKFYDVKSSALHRCTFWGFGTNNKCKNDIEIYYFLAFNKDWTTLKHAWRVPGEIVEKNNFFVGLNRGYEFNVENMKEYEITDKLKGLIKQLTDKIEG